MTKDNDKIHATELFRNTVGKVKRLQTDKISIKKQPGKYPPKPDQTGANQINSDLGMDYYITTELQPGDILKYAKNGVQPKTLKNLRNGKCRIDAECDLHGLTVPEASQALQLLMADATTNHWRYLKIIHGKGMRSTSKGPVLKGLVDHFLRQQGTVLAFHSARANDGGTGAVYVLLRST